ncbi:MAG TPA: hypothetical protein VI815_03335 [Candidatus Nanoarchaeia archaeon]|nr:hypothetical protein [Candidatus Nanoarchaeia archaeon]
MASNKYTLTLSKGTRFSLNPNSGDFLGRFSHDEVRKLERSVSEEFIVRASSHFNPSKKKSMQLTLDQTDSNPVEIFQYLTSEKGYTIKKVEYGGEK